MQALNACAAQAEKQWKQNSDSSETVMMREGLAAADMVLAYRKTLTSEGMSMLLALARQEYDQDLSIEACPRKLLFL